MNVLFVHNSRHKLAPWRDGSTRYRCYHQADALRRKGIIADVAAMAELRPENVDRYQILCMLRPRSGRDLDRLLKRCQQSAVHTVADVDDLIFNPECAALSPSVLNQQATEFSVRARFKSHLQALQGFDEITVATEPLADHWREQTGRQNVGVVPNGLSGRWLATPVQQASLHNGFARTITYLPGSSSHNMDFAEIAEVLAQTLREHPDAQLQLVGSLDIDEEQFSSRQVVRIAWVDYHRLPQIIANSTVTLAPLVRSPFTHAKSHIKFIESAAFGTPVICSPSHDICRHQSPGLSIAHNASDWQAALNHTLNNPMSLEAVTTMQAHVRNNNSAEKSADLLIAQWKKSDLTTLEQVA